MDVNVPISIDITSLEYLNHNMEINNGSFSKLSEETPNNPDNPWKGKSITIITKNGSNYNIIVNYAPPLTNNSESLILPKDCYYMFEDTNNTINPNTESFQINLLNVYGQTINTFTATKNNNGVWIGSTTINSKYYNIPLVSKIEDGTNINRVYFSMGQLILHINCPSSNPS